MRLFAGMKKLPMIIMHGIINLSERELLNKIGNTHTEHVLPVIIVNLWKQRLGLISSKKKIDIDIDSISTITEKLIQLILQ